LAAALLCVYRMSGRDEERVATHLLKFKVDDDSDRRCLGVMMRGRLCRHVTFGNGTMIKARCRVESSARQRRCVISRRQGTTTTSSTTSTLWVKTRTTVACQNNREPLRSAFLSQFEDIFYVLQLVFHDLDTSVSVFGLSCYGAGLRC
jgi:hypothetical protein